MGPFRSTLQRFLADESGQAIIEFMLLLLVLVGIVGSLKMALKKVTAKLWSLFAKRIAAPCPACDAGLEFDL